jgi:hypothetical protein
MAVDTIPALLMGVVICEGLPLAALRAVLPPVDVLLAPHRLGTQCTGPQNGSGSKQAEIGKTPSAVSRKPLDLRVAAPFTPRRFAGSNPAAPTGFPPFSVMPTLYHKVQLYLSPFERVGGIPHKARTVPGVNPLGDFA